MSFLLETYPFLVSSIKKFRKWLKNAKSITKHWIFRKGRKASSPKCWQKIISSAWLQNKLSLIPSSSEICPFPLKNSLNFNAIPPSRAMKSIHVTHLSHKTNSTTRIKSSEWVTSSESILEFVYVFEAINDVFISYLLTIFLSPTNFERSRARYNKNNWVFLFVSPDQHIHLCLYFIIESSHGWWKLRLIR